MVTLIPWKEFLLSFGKLGWTSFGGPTAHIAFLREEFVSKRRWLSDESFVDLVALCQFLPGPASSQVVFAIGMKRAGILGGLFASLLFTFPSAILMIAFAYGLNGYLSNSHPGWLQGLKIAAVSVVAQALSSMSATLCPDWKRRCIAIGAAMFIFFFPSPWTQATIIAVGGAIGYLVLSKNTMQSPRTDEQIPVASFTSRFALILFVALLFAFPMLARLTELQEFKMVDRFFRVGAMVFGGGHVALPLLHEEVVPPGWVSEEQFTAGYGAVQAVPGPLFTFSAFLGTSIGIDRDYAWARGVLALVAILLPSWLLVIATLPHWERLRRLVSIQASLCGGNAAVVGLLLAAWVDPICIEGIHDWTELVLAVVGWVGLQRWKWPPWSLVIGMAGLLGLLTAIQAR